VNGIHDMGGMHGFGPVVREADEPAFHEDWERRTFAISVLAARAIEFPVDEHRHAIENLAPTVYLQAASFERWLLGLQAVLEHRGVVTGAEVEERMAAIAAGVAT
jgi:nitrile hydratase subunit beta